jgi:RNA polymerase sigma factor (TIGR02999 family)
MSGSQTQEVTELLRAWSNGDENALDKLTPIIYPELYKIAKAYMGRERQGHILQPTALVNEAYMRLIDWESTKWNNRSHFFRASAQLMRHILVDIARNRPKIGSVEIRQISLSEANRISPERDIDVLALHEALTELEKYDERKVKIVELKFFGGLTVDEIAELLNLAPITVLRDWKMAKAWLYRKLSNDT